MQDIDNRSEPLEQSGIALPECNKPLGLFSEYLEDRIGAVAAIDPAGKCVSAEIFPSLLGVLGQGSIEKGRVGCIRSREYGILGEKSV